jgi:hypothetical protein
VSSINDKLSDWARQADALMPRVRFTSQDRHWQDSAPTRSRSVCETGSRKGQEAEAKQALDEQKHRCALLLLYQVIKIEYGGLTGKSLPK